MRVEPLKVTDDIILYAFKSG